MIRGRAVSTRSISLPDEAQTVQCEKIIHVFDIFRSRSNQRCQPAGGHTVVSLPHFLQQSFQNAVDQSEIAVIKPGLQAAHGGAADDARRFADIHPRQTRGTFEQGIGRNSDSRTDHAALILALGGHAIEGRRRAEIHRHARPANLFETQPPNSRCGRRRPPQDCRSVPASRS